MKKRITFILILMSACVTGITGLQLYWNYQNYKSTVSIFKADINIALTTAVNHEIAERQLEIIKKFKVWLADSSLVTITCDVKNRDSSTVFTMKDTHPYERNDKGISFGIIDFKEKLHEITPKAKSVFINHLADTILKRDITNGSIYYYTQRLGELLVNEANKSRYNKAALERLYKQELQLRDIDAKFTLNPVGKGIFLTRTENTGLQRPHQKDFVKAGFQSPSSYFFQQMKWLLISSLLLIGITIFCFGYTVKTILTQKKLADLKNDFVNNMTHELKTPVATINIAAEAIQDFNLSKTSTDEYLSIIRSQTGNLSILIDQILKSVIAEQETHSLDLAETDVNALISNVILDHKPQWQAAKAIINYQPGNLNTFIPADKNLLKNALANLLDNAIKYGGKGVVINITQLVDNGKLIIGISDNGPGIPPQYQEKIFDRFFRIPAGDVHNVKGYGLGLSYAKSIVTQHNGSLTMVSNEQRGTEFIITIPFTFNEKRKRTVA